MSDKHICVGAIAGGFGVHGEVKLKSFCATPEDIARYSPLNDDQGKQYNIKKIRAIKNGFAARIDEVKTREAADALRSTKLYASRERFSELTENEYYHSDLIGLDVFDGHGAKIGKVKALQNYGAGDLIELHYKTKSVLVPFTRAIVPLVDIENRKIIIDPPDGLLE